MKDKEIPHPRTDLEPCSDSELIMEFLNRRSEDAFRVLVTRHHALVMGVCRSILRSTHDAEDAFQATFMILARRARSIRKHNSLAGWIQRVAYRAALRVAKTNAQKRELTLESEPDMHEDAFQKIHDQELLCSFHEELYSMPVSMRDAIVLVHLEGRSRADAAEALECTQSAIKARLARGRKLLRNRLLRRGFALTLALKLISDGRQAQASCSLELVRKTVAIATEFGTSGIDSCSSHHTSTSIPVANEGLRNIFVHSFVRPTITTLVVVTLAVLSIPIATGQTGATANQEESVDLVVPATIMPTAIAEFRFSTAKADANGRGGESAQAISTVQYLFRRAIVEAQSRATQLELEAAATPDQVKAAQIRREAAVQQANASFLEKQLEVSRLHLQLGQPTEGVHAQTLTVKVKSSSLKKDILTDSVDANAPSL